MSQNRLTCREIVATLNDYVGGSMSTRRRAVVEAHLSRCDKCSAYLRLYRATVAAAKNAFSGEPGVSLPEEVVRSILQKRRSH
jgi:anti-sigma factor RsiW